MQISLTEETLQELTSLKDGNAHGEAYRLGAESLGLTDLAEQFENIEQQRKRIGYLPYLLDLYRRGAYEELLRRARACMSESGYQRFYMSL